MLKKCSLNIGHNIAGQLMAMIMVMKNRMKAVILMIQGIGVEGAKVVAINYPEIIVTLEI